MRVEKYSGYHKKLGTTNSGTILRSLKKNKPCIISKQGDLSKFISRSLKTSLQSGDSLTITNELKKSREHFRFYAMILKLNVN